MDREEVYWRGWEMALKAEVALEKILKMLEYFWTADCANWHKTS